MTIANRRLAHIKLQADARRVKLLGSSQFAG